VSSASCPHSRPAADQIGIDATCWPTPDHPRLHERHNPSPFWCTAISMCAMDSCITFERVIPHEKTLLSPNYSLLFGINQFFNVARRPVDSLAILEIRHELCQLCFGFNLLISLRFLRGCFSVDTADVSGASLSFFCLFFGGS
jgi:hypothetical protein